MWPASKNICLETLKVLTKESYLRISTLKNYFPVHIKNSGYGRTWEEQEREHVPYGKIFLIVSLLGFGYGVMMY